jgi:uncharacterized DUF497 family protein
MDEITFQWDERKNRENQRKHGVSFEGSSGFHVGKAIEWCSMGR